jgi:precorrin-6B methylase 2
VAHDPTIYEGTAAHYAKGRPPYSRELRRTLAGALGLDGRGRLLDVGTGPGALAIELAPLFEATVALDQDGDMLVAEMRALLEAASPTGRFRDWPGDTEILLATAGDAIVQ